MSKKTYYEILEVQSTCNNRDLKKSYHKLALIWHPDKHADKVQAQAKFTEIQEAYSTLADPKKRHQYDLSLRQPQPNSSNENSLNSFNIADFFKQKDLFGMNKSPIDILQDIFGESDDNEYIFKRDSFINFSNFSTPFDQNIKAFFNEAFTYSESEESEEDLFKNFPSFMNSDLLQMPSFFEDVPSMFSMGQDFFSSGLSFSRTNSQTFSRGQPSATANNRRVSSNANQQSHRNNPAGGNLKEHAHQRRPQHAHTEQSTKQSSRSRTIHVDDPDVIIVDEDVTEVNASGRQRGQGRSQRQQRTNVNSQQRNTRLLDFETLEEDDEDLFAAFGMDFPFKAFKRNKI